MENSNLSDIKFIKNNYNNENITPIRKKIKLKKKKKSMYRYSDLEIQPGYNIYQPGYKQNQAGYNQSFEIQPNNQLEIQSNKRIYEIQPNNQLEINGIQRGFFKKYYPEKLINNAKGIANYIEMNGNRAADFVNSKVNYVTNTEKSELTDDIVTLLYKAAGFNLLGYIVQRKLFG
jgi:hypothetical protein